MSGAAEHSATGAMRLHGTTVAQGRLAALLRGPSGAGKSDLALRFIAGGWHWPLPEIPRTLIADDQTCLDVEGERLLASAPARLRGSIEVRGVGIVPVPSSATAEVRLVVDLVAWGEVERLPDDSQVTVLLGRPVRHRKLYPFEPSAALKLALLLAKMHE